VIRTLVFDFGNVIAHFDHRRAAAALAPFTPLSVDELYTAVYHTATEHAYDRGQISTDEFVKLSMNAGQLSCHPLQFQAAFCDIFTANDPVCRAIPELAQRFRLVLASNTNELHCLQFTHQFADVLSHFAFLGTSFAAGAKKPDARFFEFIQPHCKAAANECLFFDDLPANIAGAAHHGWQAQLYVGGPLPSL
jgi:glucose-1-phosphatase